MKPMKRTDYKRMRVGDINRTDLYERIVIARFDDGSCVGVNIFSEDVFLNGPPPGVLTGVVYCTWDYCEEIPEKVKRPMTLAEVNKWWWDHVRIGNNPARKTTRDRFDGEIILFPPFGSELRDCEIFYCENYTGATNDVWIKLEVEE